MKNLKKAPDFNLPDQNGKIHCLNDYVGKWVLIYFYPKDETPGCTKEACGFRDVSADFAKKGIIVIGISKDTVASHKKFATNHHLLFSLLSDVSTETIKAYGAWGEKKFMGRVYSGILRVSFLISPDQSIQKKYEKVNVFAHAKEILNDFELLITPNK